MGEFLTRRGFLKISGGTAAVIALEATGVGTALRAFGVNAGPEVARAQEFTPNVETNFTPWYELTSSEIESLDQLLPTTNPDTTSALPVTPVPEDTSDTPQLQNFFEIEEDSPLFQAFFGDTARDYSFRAANGTTTSLTDVRNIYDLLHEIQERHGASAAEIELRVLRNGDRVQVSPIIRTNAPVTLDIQSEAGGSQTARYPKDYYMVLNPQTGTFHRMEHSNLKNPDGSAVTQAYIPLVTEPLSQELASFGYQTSPDSPFIPITAPVNTLSLLERNVQTGRLWQVVTRDTSFTFEPTVRLTASGNTRNEPNGSYRVPFSTDSNRFINTRKFELSTAYQQWNASHPDMPIYRGPDGYYRIEDNRSGVEYRGTWYIVTGDLTVTNDDQVVSFRSIHSSIVTAQQEQIIDGPTSTPQPPVEVAMVPDLSGAEAGLGGAVREVRATRAINDTPGLSAHIDSLPQTVSLAEFQSVPRLQYPDGTPVSWADRMFIRLTPPGTFTYAVMPGLVRDVRMPTGDNYGAITIDVPARGGVNRIVFTAHNTLIQSTEQYSAIFSPPPEGTLDLWRSSTINAPIPFGGRDPGINPERITDSQLFGRAQSRIGQMDMFIFPIPADAQQADFARVITTVAAGTLLSSDENLPSIQHPYFLNLS